MISEDPLKTTKFPVNFLFEDDPSSSTWKELEYQDDTSSKTLSFIADTGYTAEETEPNTASFDYEEVTGSRTQVFSTVEEKYDPSIRFNSALKLLMEMQASLIPVVEMQAALEPIINMQSIMQAVFEPINNLNAVMQAVFRPMIEIHTILRPLMDLQSNLTPTLQILSSLGKSLETLEIYDIDLKDLLDDEPKDLCIYTKTIDDLILDSEEEMDLLIDRLKKSKFDKELAEYYSKFTNKIEDLTED